MHYYLSHTFIPTECQVQIGTCLLPSEEETNTRYIMNVLEELGLDLFKVNILNESVFSDLILSSQLVQNDN